mgnify:CR=1 FL=1
MRIARDMYLDVLKNFKDQQIIKVVTGIRRCGKSTLLDPIFSNYLKQNGFNIDEVFDSFGTIELYEEILMDFYNISDERKKLLNE